MNLGKAYNCADSSGREEEAQTAHQIRLPVVRSKAGILRVIGQGDLLFYATFQSRNLGGPALTEDPGSHGAPWGTDAHKTLPEGKTSFH